VLFILFHPYNRNMSKSLLISAFEPFEKRLTNQTMVVLNHVHGSHLHKVILPVEFQHGFEQLKKHVETIQPDVVICLGEAGDASPRIEHIAMNMMHARIPDNKGYQPELTPILKGGPTSRTSLIPIENLAKFLSEKDVVFNHSFHAGTYVCNDLYYRMLSAFPEWMILFVHVSHRDENLTTSIKTIQAIIDYFQA